MKKTIYSLLAMFLLVSCAETGTKDSENVSAKNDLKLEQKQSNFLINEINLVLGEKIKIESIGTLQDFGNTTIVEYIYDGGKKGNIGFVDLYDKTGEIREEGGIRVYCSGSCDCGLEGVLDGDNTYVQCKCSSCQMHYVNTKLTSIEKSESIDFEKIATQSYLDTFGENPEKINIDSFEVEKFENSDIYTLTYSSNSKKSTVMVVTNYSFDKTAELKDFVIDCTGSCDCRERFFPSSGATECTCSPCQMKVTELTKNIQ